MKVLHLNQSIYKCLSIEPEIIGPERLVERKKEAFEKLTKLEIICNCDNVCINPFRKHNNVEESYI